MDIFAAGALFTIKFDFLLMYAFSEKLKIICTVFSTSYVHWRDCLQCQSVGLGQVTLTEPICTASSCINRFLSIIDDHIYIKANISICRQDLFSFRVDVSA